MAASVRLIVHPLLSGAGLVLLPCPRLLRLLKRAEPIVYEAVRVGELQPRVRNMPTGHLLLLSATFLATFLFLFLHIELPPF